MQSQIVIAKTNGGVFLVGKFENKPIPETKLHNTRYVITNVYEIQIVFKEGEKPKPIIMPVMFPFSDKAVDEISIEYCDFLTIIEAPDDVRHAYIKMTTGIEIISNNSDIK